MGSGDDDNSKELEELARRQFEAHEEQVVALQQKARNFLTINGLVVTAGVVSSFGFAMPHNPGSLPAWIAGFTLLMVICVAAAGRQLLKVDSTVGYKGPPEAGSSLKQLNGKTAIETRIALAHAYADAAQSNSIIASDKAGTLAKGVFWTRAAAAVCALALVFRCLAALSQ